jgi:mannose-6-phosphate isomerase-like protein (cupin superfamily)
MKRLNFVAIVAGLLAVVGPLLDRVVFPEPEPGLELVPRIGQVFHSASEGFTHRIVGRERGLIWSELTLRPHAPGPPPHVHATFSERFRVQRGTVSIRHGNEVVQLRAGEEFLVSPGVVHQPFNQSDQIAVVSAPLTLEYALPERFGIFLTQAYGFFDAAPENRRAPRALLQMSRFSPAYDSWLGGPPVALQRVACWFIGPIARLLGYRTYYPEYAPARVAVE